MVSITQITVTAGEGNRFTSPLGTQGGASVVLLMTVADAGPSVFSVHVVEKTGTHAGCFKSIQCERKIHLKNIRYEQLALAAGV